MYTHTYTAIGISIHVTHYYTHVEHFTVPDDLSRWRVGEAVQFGVLGLEYGSQYCSDSSTE